MTYRDAIDFIMARLPMFHRVGAAAYKADLDNTHALMEVLGHPELKFRSVHVAGTNGKGSCSHMIASVLQSAGYKTGLYTSPHLKDFRERIRLNGKMIPKKNVSDFVERMKPDVDRIRPSFFEMAVGMAFEYFAAEKVDIAVIETGLGGRLDSTNVVTPLISVITNIGLDHTNLLGTTLPGIAAEKAGIIKPGVPVVIGETQPETAGVFRQKAEQQQAALVFADKRCRVANARRTGKAGTLQVMDIYSNNECLFKSLAFPLPGRYQLKNILTVVCALEILREQGLKIQENDIFTGIRKVVRQTGLKGRWQVLSHSPLTVCDTGHNEDGIREVTAQIRQTPYRKLHFVLGMVNDKDITAILGLLPENARYYFCKADIPRGMDPEALREKASAFGLAGETYRSVKEAFMAAKAHAAPEDMVFVGGSTFVVAEVL